jgi:hypothetical protein
MTGTGLQKILMIGAVVLSLVLIAATAELFKQYKEATACNDIEQQIGQVEASWNKGELLILMRHTENVQLLKMPAHLVMKALLKQAGPRPN